MARTKAHSSRRARRQPGPPRSGREAAVDALTQQVPRFPADVQALSPDAADLPPRERGLALALYRTVMQRWLTLEAVLRPHVSQPLTQLEPAMRAILLSGAAQLLFMERLPDFAVVDASVQQAKQRMRLGAGRMVNAALRRVAELVVARREDTPWAPAPDRVPWRGGYIELAEPLLPEPSDLSGHLAAATSHPRALVEAWLAFHGRETAMRLLRHSAVEPPTIVAAPDADAADAPHLRAHAEPGFFLWQGEPSALRAFLAETEERRVQDPTAAAPVEQTAGVEPALIVDACAGRGTKTRQLAARHPAARILASDPDPQRARSLAEAFAGHERVEVVGPKQLRPFTGRADLLVLDVPCTNTGVLARRPEARYRYREKSLKSLIRRQQRIIEQHADLLRDDGLLLYSTCSIEPVENAMQVRWAETALSRKTMVSRATLPGGSGRTYHDGGYFAILH